MFRVFLKKHDFDPDMLIRIMLIKKKACNQDYNSETHMGQMNTYLVNQSNEYSKEVIRQTSHVPDEVGHCYSLSNCWTQIVESSEYL